MLDTTLLIAVAASPEVIISANSPLSTISSILALIFIIFASMTPFGMVSTVLYSVLSSLALPLETIMLPIFAKEFSGEKHFNYALGIFVSVNTAGYAFGGQIANLCFDIFGSYKPWFYASILIMTAIFIVMQLALSYAKRELK